MISDTGWAGRGECAKLARKVGRDAAIAVFFPPPEAITMFRPYCQRCSVQCECLLWGVLGEDAGAWGGTSEWERRAMRRELSEGTISLVDLLRGRGCDQVADEVATDG